jgi:nucleoside-diphosphate-sugar epimerase
MFFHKACNGTLEYVTSHSRDFIHIDDLCDAIEILLDSNYTGPIDIGTGVSIKIQDLFPTLPLHAITPFERQHTQADITQISSMGFRPRYKIMDFLLQKDCLDKTLQ